MKTHGMSATSIYNAWAHMLFRCENATDPHYPSYGGRGIKVCERWHSFENFLADVGERPSAEYSLDRINNDGNYEPGNVRWATKLEQSHNQRKYRYGSKARIIKAFGLALSVAEWSDRTGIKVRTIHDRLNRGLHPEKVLAH